MKETDRHERQSSHEVHPFPIGFLMLQYISNSTELVEIISPLLNDVPTTSVIRYRAEDAPRAFNNRPEPGLFAGLDDSVTARLLMGSV